MRRGYAKSPTVWAGLFDTNPLTLCGYSQLFVKFAADHEPVHVTVGKSLRTVLQLSPIDPYVDGVTANGDSGVGECLGDVRRTTSFRVVPAEFFQSAEFDGLHALLAPAHGACDPLVCGASGKHGVAQFARADLPALLGRIQREVDLAGEVVDDVHVEAGVREGGEFGVSGACDERGLQILVAFVLAPVEGVDAVEATPQFAGRRVEHVNQVEHVQAYRRRGSGGLDPDRRMPSRMQCRVEAVMQWRDITRQSQQRAGETHLARLAQRTPLFGHRPAVLAVHIEPLPVG